MRARARTRRIAMFFKKKNYEVCGFVDSKGIFHKTEAEKNAANDKYDYLDALQDEIASYSRHAIERDFWRSLIIKDDNHELSKRLFKLRSKYNQPIWS